MSEDESRHGPTQQQFLAKALYDNIAESPDELAFRRGDVITVLEQDTGGLDGWWLCALRGRQGIAPGNRLKILSGMLDTVTSHSPAASPGSNRNSGSELLDNEVAAKKEWRRSLDSSPTKVTRRSINFHPHNNVVTPVRKGDIYLYKQPNRSMEDYDVPPSRYFPSSKEASPEPPTPTDLYNTPNSVPRYNSNSSLPASLYETPPSSKRASSERTPPGSNRASLDSLASSSSSLSSSRLSGDLLLQHLYQTPPSSKRGSGGERLYETPPGSKRASLERILSDDQPTYDTPSPSAALRPLDLGDTRYDRPSGTRSAEPPGESTYDTPTPSSNASSRRHSRDSVGLGSRSSIMSTASSESGLSAGLGQGSSRLSSGALSLDSARSSLDASLHEPYDLPPRETRALKQLSCDSGLGLYDSPSLGRSVLPPHAVSCSSRLSDYARGDKPFLQADMLPRSKSVEQSIDHGEADYDLPRSNAPKICLKSVKAHQAPSGLTADPNNVYDIPPQVTRDSVISTRSDSSDDSVRLSTCSADSRGSGSGTGMEGLYEELLLDLDSALELLVKRQQDFTKAATKILAFVTPTWRTKESLQSRVYEVKVACMELKKTLVDFVYFAQGAVGNSARQADKKLISRLLKQLTPLEEERKKVSTSLRALEDMKWQVAFLVLPQEGTLEQAKEDHLGKIVSLASDLVPEVKKLASVIQSYGPQLFKRSSDLAAPSKDKPPVVAKPPIGPKPEAGSKPFNLLEATKIAGGGSGVGVVIQRPRSVQSRPLPAPPLKGLSDRPLPPPPLKQRLSGSGDSTRDYVNVKPEEEEEDDGDRDYSDLQLEYDYVQLQSSDVIAQKQQQQKKLEHNDEMEKEVVLPPQIDNGDNLQSIEEEPDTPTPTRTQAQCPELSEEGTRTLAQNEEGSAPTRHTTRVSADLGIRVTGVESVEGPSEDVDLVPSKESGHGPPPLTTHPQPLEPEWGEELMTPVNKTPVNMTPVNMTPVNKTNGFKIPSQLPPPVAWPVLRATALESSDKQVLCYYSGQLETHSTLLTNAIDAFFNCIESNEPPKVFISNSKFVIVTAHKLVYISDALHRSLANVEVRNKVISCANHVCECLKVSVQATKVAALQWPSVAAVQEMVDRVVDVSHAAHELKLVITQASSL